MNGCEWLKCPHMIEDKCTDKVDCITPEGEPCCRFREGAIVVEKGGGE